MEISADDKDIWADDDEARDDADDQEMHADAGGVLQTELIRAGCPDGINFPDAIWLGSNNPIAPHVSTHSQSPHLLKRTPNLHISHPPISFSSFAERRSSSSSSLSAWCQPTAFLSTWPALALALLHLHPGRFAPSPIGSDEQVTSLSLIVSPDQLPGERSGGGGDCGAGCRGCRRLPVLRGA